MIRLRRVTYSPKVNMVRRPLLREASFAFKHPRMALLHADPQERSLLADLLVGQKLPVKGRLEWGAEPSWPIGQSRFLQLELTGWQNLDMIVDLHRASNRAALAAIGPFDHAHLMTSPLRRWPPAARIQFAYCLALIPDFGVYVLNGALTPPNWPSFALWAQLFGRRIAQRPLIVLTAQVALLPSLDPVYVGIVEGRLVVVSDPQSFLRSATVLPDEERVEESAAEPQDDPFL